MTATKIENELITYTCDHERDGYYYISDYDFVEHASEDDVSEDYERDGYYCSGDDVPDTRW